MQQPYVSTLIEQDFTSAEKALGRHNIDAISSADLEGYATQEWVQDQNYITSADLPDVSDMANKTWTSENFYSASNPSGFITSADLQICLSMLQFSMLTTASTLLHLVSKTSSRSVTLTTRSGP